MLESRNNMKTAQLVLMAGLLLATTVNSNKVYAKPQLDRVNSTFLPGMEYVLEENNPARPYLTDLQGQDSYVRDTELGYSIRKGNTNKGRRIRIVGGVLLGVSVVPICLGAIWYAADKDQGDEEGHRSWNGEFFGPMLIAIGGGTLVAGAVLLTIGVLKKNHQRGRRRRGRQYVTSPSRKKVHFAGIALSPTHRGLNTGVAFDF